LRQNGAGVRLFATFYAQDPLFGPRSLVPLARLIRSHLPHGSNPLAVLAHEDDRKPLAVTPSDDLTAAVRAKAHSDHLGFGNAVILGTEPDIGFYLHGSRHVMDFGSNSLTVEILRAEVEGEPAGAWLARWFEAVADAVPLRHAFACSDREHGHKNMVYEGGGARAVGMQHRDALPGIYWLNFLGPAYTRLMGEEKLLAAPAHRAAKVGDGMLLQMHAAPEEWESAAAVATCAAVEHHVGPQYFFSKEDPDRKTVAPDF
jgi:hypothetical protein